MNSDSDRTYDLGYECGKADGIAGERARVTALIEAEISSNEAAIDAPKARQWMQDELGQINKALRLLRDRMQVTP